MRRSPALVAVLALCLLAGCSVNPVTGRNELLLMSEAQELDVGRRQYAPLRQSQGGDYEVDPGVEAYVREVGARLAARSDRKLPYEFNVVNDSTPNAWALPGGKIAINRGLLVELEDESQLAAVLGHEIVHAAAKHGARGQTRGVGLQLAVLAATIAGAREGYGQLAQLGAGLGAQAVNSKYGRDQELEADRYGMEYMREAGYDVRGAVELQRTFVRLSAGGRTDWLSGLFASHPPSPARVSANLETAQRLAPGGETDASRYRREMARLFETREAYEKLDEARTALANRDAAKARALVERAIRIEPDEGHFHALLGDVAATGRDWDAAVGHYDRAIALDDGFFGHYLARGKVNRARGDAAGARADFTKSVALLPTADAQRALGVLADARGDRRGAQRWAAAAARSEGAPARVAAASRRTPAAGTTLGSASRTPGGRAIPGTAPRRPGAGAPSRAALAVVKRRARDGGLAFAITNRGREVARGVRLVVRDAPGRRTRVVPVAGEIRPGATRLVRSGLRFDDPGAKLVQVRLAGPAARP